jgi:hypothetical protein
MDTILQLVKIFGPATFSATFMTYMGLQLNKLINRTHRLEENDKRLALNSLRRGAYLVKAGSMPIDNLLMELTEMGDLLTEIPNDDILSQVLAVKGK